MYYLNSFLLYSVIGFIFESTIYKINNSPRKSGIFYGPITIVYGLGIIALLLVDKYIIEKIKLNKYLKIILVFTLSTITLTSIEFICGNITHFIFNIDMWDYSNKLFNYGKYICLELALIWGLLGTLFIYIIKPFMNKFIYHIPKKATYFFTSIFITDLILILIFKSK